MENDERVVWAGDLALPDNRTLDGLRFSLDSSSDGLFNVPRIPDAALEFLALVDPNRIPLHVAVGPNLKVTSRAQNTLHWLSAAFHYGVSDTPEYDLAGELAKKNQTALPHTCSQCDVAILAKVSKSQNYAAQGPIHDADHPRVTEILIYAVANSSDTVSQPDGLVGHAIFALPLSSDVIYLPSHYQNRGLQPPDYNEKHPSSELQPGHVSLQTLKKDRLGDLFDAASHGRRRAKARGGQSVSLAAHRASPALQPSGIDGSLIKVEAVGDYPSPGNTESQIDSDSTAMRSRTIIPTTTLSSRPPSRADAIEMSKASTSQDAFQDKSIETRNRQLVSRTVMAGMRIRGLQQQRQSLSKSQKGGQPQHSDFLEQPPETLDSSNEPVDSDAEYKAVYHQTYKGVVFTLRHRIASDVLRNDEIRDLVDTLLAIFCQEYP